MITSYRGYIPPHTDYRENPIHTTEHIPEFKAIAQEMIKAEVPELVRQTMCEVLPSIIDGMMYDINTILQISMDDAEQL